VSCQAVIVPRQLALAAELDRMADQHQRAAIPCALPRGGCLSVHVEVCG
jgi:hypothetical protein